MMGDNVGVTSRKGFNSSYVQAGSKGGSLRLLIVIVGILVIILGSIGSPDNSKSRNGNSNVGRAGQFEEFYGYGRGYIVQPLNAVFIAFVIIAWIFAFAFVLALGCEISHSLAVRLNRILYPIFGVLILIGVACGCFGTYIFWQNCCHVTFTQQTQNNEGKYLTYQYRPYYYQNQNIDPNTGGSQPLIDLSEWCRCSYLVDNPKRILTNYQYTNEWEGKLILSAWPHHFIAHCASLALAVILAVLYFIACCVV